MINRVLERNGYTLVGEPKPDSYGRFSGIVADKKGNKFFYKAVVGLNGYSYKSLYNEAYLTKYLAGLTYRKGIKFGSYSLEIPQVEKIIKEGEVLCVISHQVAGKALSSMPPAAQAKILITTWGLMDKFSQEVDVNQIKPYLKNYSKVSLTAYLPFRLVKAILFSPLSAVALMVTAIRALRVISRKGSKPGLIHPDIKSGNIYVDKKRIFLLDWEEAGWGELAYNQVSTMSVHWQNKLVLNQLAAEMIPLLAYRTLVVFNQNFKKDSIRRIRDYRLLKFISTIKNRSL